MQLIKIGKKPLADPDDFSAEWYLHVPVSGLGVIGCNVNRNIDNAAEVSSELKKNEKQYYY